MKGYVFGAYMDFKCMAGKCPATCCSGWKIVVDREAYDRFALLENDELREDILSNIISQEGKLSFKNRADGSCAMLDKDGLCRIQRNSDEKTLCNTCRKYPRLSYKKEDFSILSMAASCPVVISYLCQENKDGVWYQMLEDKKIFPVLSEKISELNEEIKRFDILFQKIREKFFLKADMLCELFYDFAEIGVELVIECKDCIYLDGSFDLYETELDEAKFQNKVYSFEKLLYGEKLLNFEKNYIEYRIFTTKYENDSGESLDRLYQIAGEIIMNRVIMLSLCQSDKENFEQNLYKSMHWIYKTSVHGKISGSKLHKKIMKILA